MQIRRRTRSSTKELSPGDARIADRQRQVRQSEAKDPLRVRILRALGEAPTTPSALANELGASAPAVSRQLKALREAGLVRDEEVFGDQRQRRYLLTADGEIRLGQHRAFGQPSPAPPPPSDDDAAGFLLSALDRAVEGRRKSNRLDEAAARLSAVVDQAEARGFQDVALDATSELMITLRQNRDFARVYELLDGLGRIAHGQDERYGRELVLPADAHRDYMLGRVARREGADCLPLRAKYLVSAATSYGQLREAASGGKAARWKQRQAWSIASLASNLRERSRFEDALANAGVAMGLFEELDDSYGRSYCLFLLGFCWRLLGDFDEAWQRLKEACLIAECEGYERFEADARMQMGEVRRLQGDATGARALLHQALQVSGPLQLSVTAAFAQSALGAVEFQEHRFDEARQALREAHALFARCHHREGFALNARRQAIVARELGPSRPSDFIALRTFIVDATEHYWALHSPAGVAACHIEDARFHMLRDGDARRQIEKIYAGLDVLQDRELLEQDQWLPYLLVSFAKEVEDEALGERAERLLDEANRRRCAALTQPDAPRTTPAPPPDPPAATGRERRRFEMGGETRFKVRGRVTALA